MSEELVQVKFNAMFSPNRRLVVYDYCGILRIQVLHVGEVNDENCFKTKIVSFTSARLKILCANMSDIDKALKRQEGAVSTDLRGRMLFKAHLGGGLHAIVSDTFSGVVMGSYRKIAGEATLVPTREDGILLNVDQWRLFKEKTSVLLKDFPEITNAILCFHHSQPERIDCPECTPWDFLDAVYGYQSRSRDD